ncbi:uncharacterized protein LTHEOB_1789 [Lasiodiplodia theobromae]|uniref:uncharacterized protein n=1 Tax=Lasiodiplodia theobromae TaxID=45133 RepID=UPI0015C39D92|nr:uncharacterized protein LTHEOB_1789 [Lasiodiplodia theobromae]KAF4537598.1 hypothetical protein LTHEOB_1789 [Lasiodiplodia theobromae]
MTTSNPLRLPHSARKALLTGPTISLALPMPSIGMTHTIPSLPRRMLFAFSHLAAAQLTVADGVNTTTTTTPSTPSSSPAPSSSSSSPSATPTQQPSRTITLPPTSCTPAALELLIQWLKQSCQHPSQNTATQPLLPAAAGAIDNWRQLLRLHAAARALRVPVAEAELRALIESRLRCAPLSLAEFVDAVDTLATGFNEGEGSDDDEGGRLVKEVVRRTAGFARRGAVEPAAAEEMRGWLGGKWPGLVGRWEACDRVAVGGRRLDVRWVEGVKERLGEKARRRGEEEEEDAAKKKREELEGKVRDFEERLRRQRRLAGLQCR